MQFVNKQLGDNLVKVLLSVYASCKLSSRAGREQGTGLGRRESSQKRMQRAVIGFVGDSSSVFAYTFISMDMCWNGEGP